MPRRQSPSTPRRTLQRNESKWLVAVPSVLGFTVAPLPAAIEVATCRGADGRGNTRQTRRYIVRNQVAAGPPCSILLDGQLRRYACMIRRPQSIRSASARIGA